MREKVIERVLQQGHVLALLIEHRLNLIIKGEVIATLAQHHAAIHRISVVMNEDTRVHHSHPFRKLGFL